MDCGGPFLSRHSARSAGDPDDERHRHRHDPGAGRLRPDADLRHHGRGELRARRIVHARRLYRRPGAGGDRKFLAGAGPRRAGGGDPRRRHADRDAAAADRPRSAEHDSRHLRHFADLAELRALAVRPGGAQDQRADHHPFQSVLSRISLVPAADRAALRPHHRRLLAVSQIRQIRHLDPRHHAGPRDGAGHGHPGALGLHRGVRHRRRHGGGERRACSPRWSASTTPWGSIGC